MMKIKGFTLIEFSIVLILLGIFASLLFPKIDAMWQRKNIDELKQKIENISLALNDFGQLGCNIANIRLLPSTVLTLQNRGLIDDPQVFVNPVTGANISYLMNWSNPISYSITATMPSVAFADAHYSGSGATRQVGADLIWDGVVVGQGKSSITGKSFRKHIEGGCQ